MSMTRQATVGLDSAVGRLEKSLLAKAPKPVALVDYTVSLLQVFRFQADKYARLGYCDYETACAAYILAQRLTKTLDAKGPLNLFISELNEALEKSKPKFDEILIDRSKVQDTLKHRDLISPDELRELDPKDVLLIDFRTSREFTYSHLDFPNIVNIEPSMLNSIELPCEGADQLLEETLSRKAPRDMCKLFINRHRFRLVVIYNLRWGQALDDRLAALADSVHDRKCLISANPFKKLIEILMFNTKYISSRLKQYPLILNGGLARWHGKFGDKGLTNVQPPEKTPPEAVPNTYNKSFQDYLTSAKDGPQLQLERPPTERLAFDRLYSERANSGTEKRGPAQRQPETKPARPTHMAQEEPKTKPEKPLIAPTPPRATKSGTFDTGLTNLGNLCYMNCIIQCLGGTRSLSQFFFPNDTPHNGFLQHINVSNNLGTKGVVTTNFVALLGSMFACSGKYVTPTAFKQKIGDVSPGKQFASFDQQDCIEFLTFMLDSLHEDLNQRDVSSPDEKNGIVELTKEQEKAREMMPVRLASTIEWERYLKLNFSVIVDFFQGQYLLQLTCLVCRFSSTSYNAFSVLSLPIPMNLRKTALVMDCLSLFTETELLDDENKWHCPQCRQFRRLTKRICITRLPKVLIVHLKRFGVLKDGYFSKIDNLVTYPVDEVLDLTLFWPAVGTSASNTSMLDAERERQILADFPQRGQAPPFRYKLYGVVNHYGNLTTGHYTSFVRKGSDWCYFDDAKVLHHRPQSEVLNRNAYCLFYERI